jgi:DNA-directed RNA polymerase sigma subunit (sigma70/sigma32)
MAANIIQTLIDTRVENPIEDVEGWAERLIALGDGLEHTRDVDPTLLTENEAEVIVRYYGTHQTRREVADAMNLSPNRIDRLRHAAEEDLLAAEATLGILNGLREKTSAKSRPSGQGYEP